MFPTYNEKFYNSKEKWIFYTKKTCRIEKKSVIFSRGNITDESISSRVWFCCKRWLEVSRRRRPNVDFPRFLFDFVNLCVGKFHLDLVFFNVKFSLSVVFRRKFPSIFRFFLSVFSIHLRDFLIHGFAILLFACTFFLFANIWRDLGKVPKMFKYFMIFLWKLCVAWKNIVEKILLYNFVHLFLFLTLKNDFCR